MNNNPRFEDGEEKEEPVSGVSLQLLEQLRKQAEESLDYTEAVVREQFPAGTRVSFKVGPNEDFGVVLYIGEFPVRRVPSRGFIMVRSLKMEDEVDYYLSPGDPKNDVKIITKESEECQ
jgi:hypothetical protein